MPISYKTFDPYHLTSQSLVNITLVDPRIQVSTIGTMKALVTARHPLEQPPNIKAKNSMETAWAATGDWVLAFT